MKTLLIYDDLVSLNREAHRELKLKPAADKFGFARETNSVLIVTSELPHAALDFPCVFVSTENGYGLAAIPGLAGARKPLCPAGRRLAPRGLPACVHPALPFVLAESEGDSNFTVCLDRAYAGLNTQDGQALFEADGRETPWLEEIKQFLVAFRQGDGGQPGSGPAARRPGPARRPRHRVRTAGRTPDLAGLQDRQRGQAPQPAGGGPEGLSTQGWLGLIYAHLLSLNQVQRLAVKLDERRSQAAVERESAAAVH